MICIHHQNGSSFFQLPSFSAQLSLSGQPRGGMLPPTIDPDTQPFSYFWHPTDVIGSFGAPVASEVTPEGYVYNGFGDLDVLYRKPADSGQSAHQDAS